jgi:glycosyltransferase involved in cell wall biosynthesis
MLKLLFGMHYTIIIHGGGLKVWKFRAPFLWLFKHADNVVGVSDRISVEYGNRTGQNVITIPPLIPFVISELDKKEARSMFDLPTTATIILMVGSLTDIKCTDTTIQALAHLGNESLNKHNIFLVLAGDGAKRPEFEEEARKLHVSERVRFLGNVPREDVKYLYRAADFYVMASKFEGTPISMLEAMANGLPIIGSDAPGINALVKHGESALLFPIKDSKRLSELISSVLDDEGLRNELSQNSLVTVRSNFSYDKMVNKYKEIFRL